MTAFETVHFLNVIPMSIEKPCTYPSNSEIKRWLNQQAVRINNKTPKFNAEIEFPISDLVFFPNSKRRVTVI